MLKGSVNEFWKERKIQKTDHASEWLIVKDEKGNRVMDPEKCKDIMATHYEKLYAKGMVPHHPHHDHVKREVQRWSDEETCDGPFDAVPSKLQIKEVISKKKNNKATTDWKNEILKRGGDEMVDFIYPVIQTFWEEEKPPDHWNQGVITSLWKGKGDREKMDYHRGITVSSSIGTIAEEIITKRLMQTLNFTQAQAGGKPGGSTTDQVFVLKALISLALKAGQELYVTFFDIKKAYDRADMDDMLHVIHEQGFKGKIWRLSKALNENLTAKVKTKAGMSREVKRETGGKQGGMVMVPMFSKMMDTLSEDLDESQNIGVIIENLKIACLEYVDDVSTFAVGREQQILTLKAVDEFAIKHKLEWGVDKCKVMEIGSKKGKKESWELGKKSIGSCDTYRYLGEEISKDGKSQKNIEERSGKVKGAVRAIMTCAKSGVMKRIETQVLLRLNASVTIPTLLYNAETWILTKVERNTIDKIAIWAWKQMLGLPTTTPSSAVIFATGSMYASIQVDTKQLLYLHKLLQKEERHWAKEVLLILNKKNGAWAKRINELLEFWEVETEWTEISKKSKGEWKREVEKAAEVMNVKKLTEECQVKQRGIVKEKTKTKSILTQIENQEYKRGPLKIMEKGSVVVARAVIMGRYGMLKCRANFSSSFKDKNCPSCKMIDDENHRINQCVLYRSINLYDSSDKINYDWIYSNDLNEVLNVVKIILKMWDLGFGKNTMRV